MKAHYVFQQLEDVHLHSCLRCSHQEEIFGSCVIAEKVIAEHGGENYYTWIIGDAQDNGCKFFDADRSWAFKKQ
jgi:hypothetical protein